MPTNPDRYRGAIPDDIEHIVDSYITGMWKAERRIRGRYREVHGPIPVFLPEELKADDRITQHLVYVSKNGTSASTVELQAELISPQQAMIAAGKLLKVAQARTLESEEIETLRKIKVFLLNYGYFETSFPCTLGQQMVQQFSDIIFRYENNQDQILYPQSEDSEVLQKRADHIKAIRFELKAYQTFLRAIVQSVQNAEISQLSKERILSDLKILIEYAKELPVLPSMVGEKKYRFVDVQRRVSTEYQAVSAIKYCLGEHLNSLTAHDIAWLELNLLFLHASGHTPESVLSQLGEDLFDSLMLTLKSYSERVTQAAAPEKA